ncbi:MAG: hypothetical protein LBH60_03960, partial [Prevotellaceae bacterium]|nr:hypothetical protein [Prevotellaceae bacterium]
CNNHCFKRLLRQFFLSNHEKLPSDFVFSLPMRLSESLWRSPAPPPQMAVTPACPPTAFESELEDGAFRNAGNGRINC